VLLADKPALRFSKGAMMPMPSERNLAKRDIQAVIPADQTAG